VAYIIFRCRMFCSVLRISTLQAGLSMVRPHRWCYFDTTLVLVERLICYSKNRLRSVKCYRGKK
jgi:hypothetical protein